MAKIGIPVADMDSPWKEALHHFLSPFLAFFFPIIHHDIDWQRGYEDLDKEFQQIVRDAERGKIFADKLFKVWLNNGEEIWLLIHIEIQAQREAGFPDRMFRYNVRALEMYNRPVVSLAVLCDDNPAWRPDRYVSEKWGCTLSLQFPLVKLLDYGNDQEALERHDNPLAAIVLAHLKALETQGDVTNRYIWKLRLIRGLYERNWGVEDVRQLFRLLDWIMGLPDDMQGPFREEVHRYEEERQMPFVSSFERLAKEEGRQEGRAEGRQEGRAEGRQEGRAEEARRLLLRLGERRFGKPDEQTAAVIAGIMDVERLEEMTERLLQASNWGELLTK